MSFQNDPTLEYLAEVADKATKEASMFISGTGVVPTSFGNHGGGISDPDESMAFHCQNANLRAEANAMNYLADAPVVGTGLKPYADVLNTADQTLMYAVNNPGYMMPGKTASEEIPDELHYEIMKSANLFHEYIPTKEDWMAIYETALEKTANDVEEFITAAIEDGYFDAVGLDDIIDLL